MKVLILSLLVLTTLAFESSQNCSNLSGKWNGIVSYQTQDHNNICLYISQYQTSASNKFFDCEGETHFISYIGNDAHCPFYGENISGQCYPDTNNYLELQYETINTLFQGQAQSDLIMTQTLQHNFQSTFTQVPSDSKDEFSVQLNQAIQNLQNDKQDYIEATCTDLRGQWQGKLLLSDKNEKTNCAYDVTSIIYSTTEHIEINIEAENGNLAGLNNHMRCPNKAFIIKGNCQKSQKIVNAIGNYVSYYTQDILIFYDLNLEQYFLLVRDSQQQDLIIE